MKHHPDIRIWLLRQGRSAGILECIPSVLPLILCASSKHCLPAITLSVSYLQFVGLMVFAYFGSPFAWSIDYQIFILN
jgi:hypothetical protein